MQFLCVSLPPEVSTSSLLLAMAVSQACSAHGAAITLCPPSHSVALISITSVGATQHVNVNSGTSASFLSGDFSDLSTLACPRTQAAAKAAYLDGLGSIHAGRFDEASPVSSPRAPISWSFGLIKFRFRERRRGAAERSPHRGRQAQPVLGFLSTGASALNDIATGKQPPMQHTNGLPCHGGMGYC